VLDPGRDRDALADAGEDIESQRTAGLAVEESKGVL